VDAQAQVALIGLLGTLILGLLPALVQSLRARGLEINIAQETLIRGSVIEGVRFAEEFARKSPTTGSEKLALATKYAQGLLADRGIKTRMVELASRVEANITPALPARPDISRLEFPK